MEIIPGFLYMGNLRQANAAYIQKDLKLKAHINCSNQTGEILNEEGLNLLTVPVTDDSCGE